MKNIGNYHNIVYKSTIPVSLKDQLERLFFFNENQSSYIQQIESIIEKRGYLKILSTNGECTINNDDQIYSNIFALDTESSDSSVLGVILFVVEEKVCQIDHIAIHSACQEKKELGRELVFPRLYERVRLLCKGKGVKLIRINYINKSFSVGTKFINIVE